MPRYNRVEDIIQLALALQAQGPGLCLEDIQQRFEVGRRTAERMREAVDRLYPGMASSKGPDGRKYWSLPPGCANGLVTWQPDELRALDEAIADAQRGENSARGRVLAALRDKMEALTEPAEARGAEPQPNRPLPPLPRAIVEDREVTFYRTRADGERVHALAHPYGMLGGPRRLVIAYHPDLERTCLHPVEGLSEVTALTSGFERNPVLDMRRFAANAFVPSEDGPVEICWRFVGEAADDVLEYEFHEAQELEQRSDGSVQVRFVAGSLVEVAWHLFTWGDRIESVDPPVLKDRFDAMMRHAMTSRATDTRRPRMERLDG